MLRKVVCNKKLQNCLLVSGSVLTFRWAHTRIMIYLKEILLVFIISTRVDAGCQDMGCSRFEKGAQCYPWDWRDPSLKGMDCAYGLCRRSPGSSPHCRCCNKKCRDYGCSKEFDGRGRCSDRKLSRFCFEGLCHRSKRKLKTLKLDM